MTRRRLVLLLGCVETIRQSASVDGGLRINEQLKQRLGTRHPCPTIMRRGGNEPKTTSLNAAGSPPSCEEGARYRAGFLLKKALSRSEL